MRVLCCGSRYWGGRPIEVIRLCEALTALKETPEQPITIIHGKAKGADALAGEVAKKLGFAVEEYPADWRRFGRAAGPIRNQQMLDTGIDIVFAFHEDLGKSKGTKDMVTRAEDAGVPVRRISWSNTPS